MRTTEFVFEADFNSPHFKLKTYILSRLVELQFSTTIKPDITKIKSRWNKNLNK